MLLYLILELKKTEEKQRKAQEKEQKRIAVEEKKRRSLLQGRSTGEEIKNCPKEDPAK